MSSPSTAASRCYRHPDRESWVLCQRCGRTVCPQCQTQAAVGVHCPECVREGRPARPPRGRRVANFFRPGGSTPAVTYTLIGVNLAVFALQFLSGGLVTALGVYVPQITAEQPWRMITAIFLHSPSWFLHILFNMYALFLFGPTLEAALGRVRFLALYLTAGFAGSVAVLLLAPNSAVLGASGAVFGLFGAFFVIQRRMGANATQIFVIIAINFALGFFIANVSWQAHLGGLVGGAAIAAIYTRTRRREQRAAQIIGVAGVIVVLIAVTVVLA